MPLENAQPDDLLPMEERRQAGHDLRRLVPRGQHAVWQPPDDRRDPLQLLAETSRHRISSLLPIRYGRMQPSAFAFLRGSAAIMAADLASTPTSGIWVQSCGDCHLANFGSYAALDGTPVFDINDFDETLPAPFEWDVKRLATSFTLDARGRGMTDRASRHLARSVVTSYRQHMAMLMRLDPRASLAVAGRCDRDIAGDHRGKSPPARIETPAHGGRCTQQGLSEAARADQVRLAHQAAAAADRSVDGPVRQHP